MANKDSVIFYQRQRKICKEFLNMEQFGRLMDALFDLDDGGDPDVSDDKMVAMAFAFMSLQQQIDREKYEKICARNRENGKRGGAPKGNQNAKKTTQNNRTVFKTTQNNPNDNVNDNENDNDNVNVNDNEGGPDDDDGLFKRHPHGFLENVMLTEEEYKALYMSYSQVEKLINKVSAWLPNRAKRNDYDHYSLCLKFADNDQWPKREKHEPYEPPKVTDPISEEEQKKLMAEMKGKLTGIFSEN